MEAISRNGVSGGSVGLITTDIRHFDENGRMNVKKETASRSFSDVLMNAVTDSDEQQKQSDNLEETMITNPEKVDIDQVMIASEKARLSVTFLKTITDKVVKAYNDLMMLR